jgi:hypothetical protein
MQTEELRLEYVFDVAEKQLAKFEKKYGAYPEVFINYTNEHFQQPELPVEP